MSMDPHAALWTIALYAGEPDPLDLWEMDDGTPVDIGACVRALAGALGEAERLRVERDAKSEEIEGFWRPTRDDARRLAVEYIEKNARAHLGTYADTAKEIAEARGWAYLIDAAKGWPS